MSGPGVPDGLGVGRGNGEVVDGSWFGAWLQFLKLNSKKGGKLNNNSSGGMQGARFWLC